MWHGINFFLTVLIVVIYIKNTTFKNENRAVRTFWQYQPRIHWGIKIELILDMGYLQCVFQI